eukprot:3844723-Rhodomonas_salina.1
MHFGVAGRAEVTQHQSSTAATFRPSQLAMRAAGAGTLTSSIGPCNLPTAPMCSEMLVRQSRPPLTAERKGGLCKSKKKERTGQSHGFDKWRLERP